MSTLKRTLIIMCDTFELNCSDEEKYELKPNESGQYLPSNEKVLELFEELDKNGILSLSWTCPGRRAPTPEHVEQATEGEGVPEIKHDEKDDYFDFEVDKAQVKLRPSGDVGPKGSAKKKTTSLDAILMDMARHRRMDMMDQDPQ